MPTLKEVDWHMWGRGLRPRSPCACSFSSGGLFQQPAGPDEDLWLEAEKHPCQGQEG